MFNLAQLFANAKSMFYNLMHNGAPVHIAGATGLAVRSKKVEAITAGKSKRVMLMERGAQPEHRKARRIERTKMRLKKRANSYCNNLNANGEVIKN